MNDESNVKVNNEPRLHGEGAPPVIAPPVIPEYRNIPPPWLNAINVPIWTGLALTPAGFLVAAGVCFPPFGIACVVGAVVVAILATPVLLAAAVFRLWKK